MFFYFKIFIFLNFLFLYNSLLITWIVGTIATTVPLIYNFGHLKCSFSECCKPHSKWIPMNLTKFDLLLRENLFGQHLVHKSVYMQVHNHINNKNPKKALLLSFNGMPGTGKNYVSTMLADSLYWNGMKNDNVKLYVASHHFPNVNYVEGYKIKLREEIMEMVKRCPHSLFIFDEVHEMPPTLLDSLKAFVDTHESVDGIDFRHSIFILLSNSGAKDIIEQINRVWSNGKSRETLTLKQMEEALSKNLYKMKDDGLQKSKLILHNLITAFVPFLPLEKKHVEMCVKNLLRKRNMKYEESLVNDIVNEFNYQEVNGVAWALHGCKRIEDKLNLYV